MKYNFIGKLKKNVSGILLWAVTFSCMATAAAAEKNLLTWNNEPEVLKKEWSGKVGFKNLDGKVCGYIDSPATVISRKLIPVEPGRQYRLSGEFKGLGKERSILFFGLMTFDKNKQYIAPVNTNIVTGSATVLAKDCRKGDKLLILKSNSKWKAGDTAVFNAKDDLSDLPNRELTGRIRGVVRKDNGIMEVQLSAPVKKDWPSGTKMRTHCSHFGEYLYCSAMGAKLPGQWKTFSRIVSPARLGRMGRDIFRPGTAYVKVVILANYAGKKDARTAFADVTLTQVSNQEPVLFRDIRRKAARIAPYSEEDYRLGTQLMKEMKTLGAKKKLVLDRKYFIAEGIFYSTGRLYYSRKKWFDMPLFSARDMWEPGPSEYKMTSFLKNYQLLRETGADAFAFYLESNDGFSRALQAAEAVNGKAEEQGKIHVIPILFRGKVNAPRDWKTLKSCAQSPSVFKLNGKPLVNNYLVDHRTPAATAEAIQMIKQRTGQDFAYIHQLGELRSIPEDPYNLYIIKKAVPATLMLEFFDGLTRYLRACDGINYRAYLSKRDNTFYMKYYDDVILPLFTAACAQDEFNGKKVFEFQIMPGYAYYCGVQSLSWDGTKTMRNYLELCRKYPVDMLLWFEWDEIHEDTRLEPTVYKPMAAMRIVRYYNSLFKNRKLTPMKGDDLSLPNLVVSQPRQFVLGRDFEFELLNVPDTEQSSPYSVVAELTDHDGKTVYKSKPLNFDTARLQDHTISIPSAGLSRPRLLSPRLTIHYRGKQRVISEGLPFSILRPTASCDCLWVCTPLRNLMFPKTKKIGFKKVKSLDPMVKIMEADVKLDFPGHKLTLVDILQNSNEIYVYDPQNEFLRDDPSRRLFRFTTHNLRHFMKCQVKWEIVGAPSAIRFVSARDGVRENPTLKHQAVPFREPQTTTGNLTPWLGSRIFSIKKEEIENAVMKVSVLRLEGYDKGKTSTWSLPLRELGEYGVKMKIFEDGLQFGVETMYRPDRLALPVNKDSAEFKSRIAADQPDGILGVCAVSRDGKVWWSRGHVVNPSSSASGKVRLYNDRTGPFSLDVAANRIPHIRYKFDPKFGGGVLTTDAGREYYGVIGGYLPVPVGFEGHMSSKGTIPYQAEIGKKPGVKNCTTPVWKKLDDGSYALAFDGKYNNFIAFPPTVIPQRAGFTIRFEVFPEDVNRDQVYLHTGNCETFLLGFELRTENGRFVVDFFNRRPHDLKSRYTQVDKRKTSLAPEAGKWNKIEFVYDGNAVVLEVNGKRETLPFSGITHAISSSCFGGVSRSKGKPQYFQGMLRSFEVIHSPEP